MPDPDSCFRSSACFSRWGWRTFVLATYLLRRTSRVDRRLRDITEVSADRPTPADLDLARPAYGNLGRLPAPFRNRRRRSAGCAGG